jgi:hypothetical protein
MKGRIIERVYFDSDCDAARYRQAFGEVFERTRPRLIFCPYCGEEGEDTRGVEQGAGPELIAWVEERCPQGHRWCAVFCFEYQPNGKYLTIVARLSPEQLKDYLQERERL